MLVIASSRLSVMLLYQSDSLLKLWYQLQPGPEGGLVVVVVYVCLQVRHKKGGEVFNLICFMFVWR
jgi:hypothetical protein